MEVLRFDIAADGWGISICEAERIEDVFTVVSMWRVANPGFFSSTQASPSLPVTEVMPLYEQLMERLATMK